MAHPHARLPIEPLLGLAIVPLLERAVRARTRRMVRPWVARYALAAGLAAATFGIGVLRRLRQPLEAKAYPPAHVP